MNEYNVSIALVGSCLALIVIYNNKSLRGKVRQDVAFSLFVVFLILVSMWSALILLVILTVEYSHCIFDPLQRMLG